MQPLSLYYHQPASSWEETLPLGNGSLGALVWGGAQRERWGLNQETLWSGFPRDKNNPEALGHLDEARRLVFQGRYRAAEELIRDTMLGEYNESYLPLGELTLTLDHEQTVEDYRRELDLTTAQTTVSYRVGERHYRRECFVSYPRDALVIRLTCDAPVLGGQLSFASPLEHRVTAERIDLTITGRCPEHVDPSYVTDTPEPVVQGTRGREFQARLRVLECDGTLKPEGEALRVEGASVLVLTFSAVRPARMEASVSYPTLLEEHRKDFGALFDRVELYLGPTPELATDERLTRLKEGHDDPALYALFFQYGRYLLISSSRQGSLPANLQGLWSWELRAPWSSNWTTNINTQMNYWPAQSCNLAECLPPYFDFLRLVAERGADTARIHYGARGFTVHHNVDVWGSTNPAGVVHGEGAGRGPCVQWAFWPLGGAWLISELFKHYEYNPDEAFLRETAYPLIRGAALFLADWLVLHDGLYETAPSTSPENRFRTTEGDSAVARSAALDLELVREVFGHFRATCARLGIADPLLPEINEKLARLRPFAVGSLGQLLEWHVEFEELEPGHRHLSHLYGLFPSELFANDPAMIDACRVSLIRRLENGGGHTGWSCAWILNLFAVLGDADQAYHYLETLLTKSTYPNLWDAHPPFQIDGNFGGTAGIANLLVQDRGGRVTFLPALPRQWPDGWVRGLRIKNGKTVDLRWQGGQLIDSRVY